MTATRPENLAAHDLKVVVDAARVRWFGPEPVDPAFEAGLKGRIASVACAVETAVVAAKITADALQGLSLDATPDRLSGALELCPRPDQATTSGLRVVLMGRTQAGKSTLLAVLSGNPEHVERIGIGGTRTTRESFETSWSAHPEVMMVDTPGVGAADGREDYEKAFSAVRSADLVVWVQSNDSAQQESLDAITDLACLGKPMLLVLNCNGTLTSAEDDPHGIDRIGRFLRKPEQTFQHTDGHLDRLQRHLDGLGITWAAITTVHLRAAELAVFGDPRAEALRIASKVEEIETVLLDELRHRAPTRRLVNMVDQTRVWADLTSHALHTRSEQAREDAGTTVQAGEQLAQEQRRALANHVDRARGALAKVTASRVGWQSSKSLDNVVEHWIEEQKAIDAEVADVVQDLEGDLARSMAAVAESVSKEWRTRKTRHTDLPGRKKAWKNQALKIAPRAITTALVLFPPTQPIAAGATVLEALLGRRLNRFIDSKTSSQQRLDLKHLEKIGHQVQAHLDEVATGADGVVDLCSSAYEERIEAELVAARTRHDGQLKGATDLDRSVAKLQREIRALDTATVQALLAEAGAPRIAAGIRRGTRAPGVVTFAEASGPARDEFALFPVPGLPDRTVLVTPISMGPAIAQAGLALNQLLGSWPRTVEVTCDSVVLQTDRARPSGMVTAWAEALSDFVSAHVRVIPPGDAA